MLIKELNIYPLKSGSSLKLDVASIVDRGLQYDRLWALFDENKTVITGRTDPTLLQVRNRITKDELILSAPGLTDLSINLDTADKEKVDLKTFSTPGNAIHVDQLADEWFSELMGKHCGLYFMNEHSQREVLSKNGGQPGDQVSFADESPILLTNQKSLHELNAMIDDHDVDMRQFRPNIVVSGSEAFEEDTWKRIKIGECEFDVNQRCVRCVFTTINPDTRVKHPDQEPLRTLAAFRKDREEQVSFGIHLIPRKLGQIKVEDRVEIIE